MPEDQSFAGQRLTRLGQRVVALIVVVALAWIAWGYYGDYRTAARSAKNAPSASSGATGTVDATGTPASGEGSSTPTKAKPAVLVLAEGLNLRQKPMTSAKIIKKLKKGISLELLETANGWYRVRDPEGDEGWVAAGGNYTELVK